MKNPPAIQTLPELLQRVQANAYVVLPIREFNRLFDEQTPAPQVEANSSPQLSVGRPGQATAITSRSARILHFCACHKLALRAMRQYCLVSRGVLSADIFRNPTRPTAGEYPARNARAITADKHCEIKIEPEGTDQAGESKNHVFQIQSALR